MNEFLNECEHLLSGTLHRIPSRKSLRTWQVLVNSVRWFDTGGELLHYTIIMKLQGCIGKGEFSSRMMVAKLEEKII